MKSEWARRSIARRDFRRGGVDPEDFEEQPYRKPKSGDWRSRKKNKACKKSKTGDLCAFTKKKVIGTDKRLDRATDTWYNVPRTIMTCERCGKYDYSTYWWSYLN